MADTPTSDANTEALELATARKRFAAAIEANGPWSIQAAIDLKWRAGTDGDRSYQWPAVVQQARDQQQLPFETVNLLPASIKQVTNQQRQAGLTMQVVPLKGHVSEADAEVREGLLRHTMLISDGEMQVDTAFEDMATHGKGFVEAVTRYADDDEETDEQEIYIEWRDPFTIFLDPTAVKLDKSDMKYAFVPYDVPTEDYNRLYSKSQVAKNGVEQSLAGMIDQGDRSRWFPQGAVRIARYYTVEEETDPIQPKNGTRELKRKYVQVQVINALEVLETKKLVRMTDTAGIVRAVKRIPIVPMLGDRFVIDGKEDYRGMVRLARGPQQMLNYWITYITEQLALTSRAPYVVGASQVEGYEDFWKDLNKPNKLLLYNDKAGMNGQPGNQNPPQRNIEEPPIQAAIAALSIAKDSLQHVMQIFDPSLGKAKSDQSGTAIQSLQQQGEIGTSNYLDNEKRFLRSLGRLLLQMYPIYYDTARMRRIIGKDERPLSVYFHAGADNAPTDDELQEAKDNGIGIEGVYDLEVGHYDVTVSTGPNFLSRRQEANAGMAQIWKALPATLPMMLPTFLDNSDWPGAAAMAKIARRTISAPFEEPDPNNPDQQLAKMKQTLDQAMQQHQILVKELNAKTQYIQTDQAKQQAQENIHQMDLASKERIAAFQGEVQLAINAAKLQQTQDLTILKAKLDALEVTLGHVHEAAMAHADRAHDAATQAQDHAHAANLQTQAEQTARDLQTQGAQQQAAPPAPDDASSTAAASA